jgi:hypothetical protein
MLYFKKYIRNNSKLLSSFSNTNYRSIYTGNDERYSINETNNESEIYNIYKNHENKKLLNILENDEISINTKLDLLDDNTFKSINLTTGGLMNDFNFTI